MKSPSAEKSNSKLLLDPLGFPISKVYMVDDLVALDSIFELKFAKRRKKYFLDAPGHCDLCRDLLIFGKYMIDGRTKNPVRWAFMCEGCFRQHGVAIGWGFGQLYLRQPRCKWLLVAGSAPPDHVLDLAD